ncbi:hypothetical protein BCR35DRAFT_288748 [Leucosporidium creatinivorum]|uniref:Short-chain dehydrogenase/reductase 3 n=1 Tax=Leucosporidium creatinivorum TaxID=106004 RepID=A0A1Y2FWY1_9BASI|nr:hypothetical protein BCR35DRAFT_288748 [Leucosporidium creatinivorum]
MTLALPLLHTGEGLTIDSLYRLLQCLLKPTVAVLYPLAVLATHREELIRRGLLGLEDVWKGDWRVKVAVGVLGLAVGIKVNDWLSSGARNNWARDSSWDWEKEVVVVTGGSNGIGRVLVDKLSRKGIKVAVLDVVEPAPRLLPGSRFYRCDLSKKEQVDAAALEVVKLLGHPTVLVNMAGIVRCKTVLDSSARDIDLTYDINVKAHYYTAQAFLPEMIKQGHGHVVTIASNTAFIQAPLGVSYCSSKSSALSFHEGLTLELRHTYTPTSLARRIRTSVVCPGHVKTDMFTGLDQGPWMPQWAMPSLSVDTVAGLVERVVLSGESQYIIEPLAAKIMPWLRVLPTWVHAFVHSLAKDAMTGVSQVQKEKGVGVEKKQL